MGDDEYSIGDLIKSYRTAGDYEAPTYSAAWRACVEGRITCRRTPKGWAIPKTEREPAAKALGLQRKAVSRQPAAA
jgi:hypothetical protein